MEKPDVKQAGLEIAESALMKAIDSIINPYAEYYALEKGGNVGKVLFPFIENLTDYLKKEVVDKIDGKDDIQ